ncbi:MAG TPA: hypothetical protein VJ761_05320 [Ktedonobacteraceae bacterium]|nr:hypothetical protein [Ktedonobacteraceae bacterium]
MEERLVTLIAHLVTSGLNVEQALEMGRLYALAHYLRAVHIETAPYALYYPKDVERMRAEAHAQAEKVVNDVVRRAWRVTEQLRKTEATPEKHYTQSEVLTILKPFVLGEKDLWQW